MEAMDMENSRNPGGGSSETREKSYDVYLSFRGRDTRFGFVDHLCRSLHQAGIRVFMDSEELTAGEPIEQSLTQAIGHSKIAIPILSANYALSKWCLQELAQIVECRETMGQIIMPVFLRVTASVVRHRSDGYGEAIAKHRRRGVDPDTLRKWEEALNRVGHDAAHDVADSAATTSLKRTRRHERRRQPGRRSGKSPKHRFSENVAVFDSRRFQEIVVILSLSIRCLKTSPSQYHIE